MTKYLSFFFLMILLFLSLVWTFYSSANGEGIHITTLGDSITHGTGDPSKQGYVRRVEKKIKEKLNIPVQVNNFGVPKYTTENILIQLNDKKIKEQLQDSNYIILYIGTNDFRKSADYTFKELDERKINKGKLVYTKNLNKILYHIRKENGYAPIIVLGLYQPYTEYENHVEITNEIKKWNKAIKNETAGIQQAFYVPILDLFYNKPKKQLFSDSIHPNPDGYELIADRVYEELSNLDKNN